MRIHLAFGFVFFKAGWGSHGWLKYFLLKILEIYFLPKILKRYFLPKYLRDPLFSGSNEISSPWWLSLQILYNEGFPWRWKRNIRGIKPMVLGESCSISNLWFWDLFARVGQGGLGEVVATTSIDCKCLFNVLINIWMAYFLLVYVSLHMLVYCRWIGLI